MSKLDEIMDSIDDESKNKPETSPELTSYRGSLRAEGKLKSDIFLLTSAKKKWYIMDVRIGL